MRDVTVTLYEFKELDEKAKEKALEKFRYANVEYEDWAEFLLEDAKNHLDKLGYQGQPEILYSGFSSQGDGLSFTAAVNLRKWLSAKRLSKKYAALARVADEVNISIVRSDSRYYHEYTMQVQEWDTPELSNKALEQLTEVMSLIQEDARDQARKIYKQLEKEYDYQTDDEQVADFLEANQIEFTKDGQVA